MNYLIGPTLFAVCCILSNLTTVAANAAEKVSFPASEPYINKKVTLTGKLSLPKGNGPFPAVVLMHGCAGLGDAVPKGLRSHAKSLNQSSFATLILDSFGPRGLHGNRVCSDQVALLNASSYRVSDAYDALKFLRSKPFIDTKNIFQLGQSNGGSVSLRLAQSSSMIFSGKAILGDDANPFRAVAAFYPSCAHVASDQLELIADVILFLGGKDNWTPPDNCFGNKSTKRFSYQPVLYRNAAHSFDLPIPMTTYLGYRVGMNQAATKDSRRRMIKFFISNTGR